MKNGLSRYGPRNNARAFAVHPSGKIRSEPPDNSLYLDADFLLQDPSAAEKILRSLTEKEIQSVIALPKILRLRDGQYLEKLRKLLLENLAYIKMCFSGWTS